MKKNIRHKKKLSVFRFIYFFFRSLTHQQETIFRLFYLCYYLFGRFFVVVVHLFEKVIIAKLIRLNNGLGNILHDILMSVCIQTNHSVFIWMKEKTNKFQLCIEAHHFCTISEMNKEHFLLSRFCSFILFSNYRRKIIKNRGKHLVS